MTKTWAFRCINQARHCISLNLQGWDSWDGKSKPVLPLQAIACPAVTWLL